VHELGLTSDVLAVCEASLAAHGRGRIEVVRLRVGDLAAVEPDLLRYAWEALTAGGPHAGSRLEIEWRPARQVCRACAAEKPRARGDWWPLCPDCGAVLAVEGGDELEVIDIRVVLEEPAGAAVGAAPCDAVSADTGEDHVRNAEDG
jgi:hydrogenase nickel incorporation protein HypA/HybF